MHYITQLALLRRDSISDRDLSILLGQTEAHVAKLREMKVSPTARELAIMRICANVPNQRLEPILRDLRADHEWRLIPGFEKYEVSADGRVRRSAAGHGSIPGHVLKPRRGRHGHLYVNAADNEGHIVNLAVHRALCLAFVGPPPSPESIACHENDVPSDNRPDNVYWGTHQTNAIDRERNRHSTIISTQRAHGIRKALVSQEITPRQARYLYKKTMDYRKRRNTVQV